MFITNWHTLPTIIMEVENGSPAVSTSMIVQERVVSINLSISKTSEQRDHSSFFQELHGITMQLHQFHDNKKNNLSLEW